MVSNLDSQYLWTRNIIFNFHERKTQSNGMKGTEVPKLQDVPQPKSLAPPPYSPNGWSKLAQIFGGSPYG